MARGILNQTVIRELGQIVGKQHILYDQPEDIAPYSHDEVAGHEYSCMPEIVVKPRSAKEIFEIMKVANRELIPVTPPGAGSGLSGGAVSTQGGILLSTERMNQILEIDKENLIGAICVVSIIPRKK